MSDTYRNEKLTAYIAVTERLIGEAGKQLATIKKAEAAGKKIAPARLTAADQIWRDAILAAWNLRKVHRCDGPDSGPGLEQAVAKNDPRACEAFAHVSEACRELAGMPPR